MALFKRKGKISIDHKKKTFKVNEDMCIHQFFGLIVKYFVILEGEEKGKTPAKLIHNDNGKATLILTDGWRFEKGTASKFNQKVNKRYKRINRATRTEITSEYIRA